MLDEQKLGGAGRDRLIGGSGGDEIRTRGGGADVVDCGAGRDTLTGATAATARSAAKPCADDAAPDGVPGSRSRSG